MTRKKCKSPTAAYQLSGKLHNHLKLMCRRIFINLCKWSQYTVNWGRMQFKRWFMQYEPNVEKQDLYIKTERP